MNIEKALLQHINLLNPNKYTIKSCYCNGSMYLTILKTKHLLDDLVKLKFYLDSFEFIIESLVDNYVNHSMTYEIEEDYIELNYLIEDEYINDFIFYSDVNVIKS